MRKALLVLIVPFLALAGTVTETIEFDSREHPLATVLGQTYHSSTLNQFLGQLERVGIVSAVTY